MPTFLQTILSTVTAAAIIAVATYLIKWGKRMSEVEDRMVQIGEEKLPKPTGALEFYDKGHRYAGTRMVPVPVKFRRPFKRQPKIVAALQKIDLGSIVGEMSNAAKPQGISNANNHRILVRVEDPGLEGFTLCFETWEDSIVFDVWACWIAVSG